MAFVSRQVRAFFVPKEARLFFSEQKLNIRKEFHSSLVKMSENDKRGAFIVLEGCDRCGKTTQAKLLVKNLEEKGHNVKFLSFPDRTTKVGSLINSYLTKAVQFEDHVIHLLFSANRWEMKDKILRLMNDNTTLIVDRYSFSGVAFSASKPEMELDWCKQPEVGLPAPDVVLFLDVSPNIASQRGQYGNERYEDEETQQRVRNMYDSLKDDNWKVINANDKSREELQEELMLIALDVIANVGNTHIKTLFKN